MGPSRQHRQYVAFGIAEDAFGDLFEPPALDAAQVVDPWQVRISDDRGRHKIRRHLLAEPESHSVCPSGVTGPEIGQ